MFALLVLFACVSDAPVAAESPTWHQDVAPIFLDRCAGCHASGGIAPFALDSFAVAGPMAAASLAAIEAGTMPPFDARESETCTPRRPWRNDPRPTEEEKALVRAWVEAGAPEGDALHAAPLPSVHAPTLDRVDRELRPKSGYATGGGNDEFVCVSMDAEVLTDTWVTGTEVIPGNPLVNHHVVVWTDPHGESAGWGNRYQKDCSSFSGFDDSQPLLVWTPGADPNTVPEGSGVVLPAGSRIAMQIHFHPTGPVADPDITTVRLRFAESEPELQALLVGIGNFASEDEGLLPGPNDRRTVEFRIPPDVADHTETMTTDQDGQTSFRFFSMMPHQHYIGTGMEVHWTHKGLPGRADDDECLINAGWDFDWQRTYTYDVPVDELPAASRGDTFWMQCHYDNTLNNPGVVRALADAGLTEPVAVGLGETTLDEMCVLIAGVLF